MSRIRSITHAISILRLIGQNGPLSLSDVARNEGLSPSSGLAILRTLVAEGALERDGKTKLYCLTPEWSGPNPFTGDRLQVVIDRMRPTMMEIRRTCQSTVGLWKVIPGRRLRLAAYVDTDAPIRIQMAPGQRQPLGGGAVGRILSAVQEVDDEELALRFAETRWEREITLDQYIGEVREARVRGYAIDDGILHAGICSLAAALSEPHAGFSISMTFFAGSRSADEIRQMGEHLAASCQQLGTAASSQQGKTGRGRASLAQQD
jgi:DNA-binding IclR family transcriptional regulator